MNAATYFARVATLLPDNPPSKDDAAILEKMKAIGLAPGKPFDASKLDPGVAQALDEGVQAAIQAVSKAAASGSPARTSATAGASTARSDAGATTTAARDRRVERHRRQRARGRRSS